MKCKKIKKEKNRANKKQIDKKFVFLLALLVLCAAFLTVRIIRTNMEKTRVAKLEALYYGGEIPDEFKPKWRKMPDKTLEIHDDLVAEVKENFQGASIERIKDVKDEYIYTIRTAEGTDKEFLQDKLRIIYVKYRDLGYKGSFYVYIGDSFFDSLPHRG